MLFGGPKGIPSWMPKEILLVLYMSSALLTGCIYFALPSYRRMLLLTGAYAWRCDGVAQTGAAAPKADNSDLLRESADADLLLCDAQDAALSPLFTMALLSHCIMSAIAGMLLDRIGPKVTALIGHGLIGLGWLLLAFSSKSFPAYYMAFICIGLGSDTGYLPLLKIVNLFSSKSGTIISLMGVACTASFGVPVVLESLWSAHPQWSFATLCCLYTIVGPGFSALVDLFLVPWKAFPVSRRAGHKDSSGDREARLTSQPHPSSSICSSLAPLSFPTATTPADADLVHSERGSTDTPKGNIDVLVGRQPAEASSGTTQATAAATEAAATPAAAEIAMAETATVETAATEASSGISAKCMDIQSRMYARCKGQDMPGGEDSDGLHSNATFFADFLSIRYLSLPIMAASQQTAISFYQMAAFRLLDGPVADNLSTSLVFSFIPCVFLGAAVDCWGVFPVLAITNTLGFLAYACTLGAPSYASHMVSLVCFCSYVSLDCELVFCCISKMFSSNNFGRLCGISQAVAGLISLVAIPLYNHVSLQLYGGNCRPVAWGLMVMLVCLYPLIIWVKWVTVRGRRVALKASSLSEPKEHQGAPTARGAPRGDSRPQSLCEGYDRDVKAEDHEWLSSAV